MGSEIAPTGRSRLAQQLVLLDPRVRATLKLSDALISLIDVAVTLSNALTDKDDARPWQEKLGDVFDNRYSATNSDEIAADLNSLKTLFESDVGGWVRKLKSPSAQLFLRRLLGAKVADQLNDALREDAAVVISAIRQGMRAVMPYSVAIQDAVSMLPPSQVAKTEFFGPGAQLLRMLIDLDQFLGQNILEWFELDVEDLASAEAAPIEGSDIDRLTQEYRAFVSQDSANQIQRINAALVRKIRGARQALDYSEDGVSQAANSLIELIDRLLREAFTKDQVLAWLSASFDDISDFTYLTDAGVVLPTKMGECLCFIFGGHRPEQPGSATPEDALSLHHLLAQCIVSARSQLQKFKHADNPTEEQMVILRSLLVGIEGALTLAVRMGFGLRAGTEVDAIADNLNLDDENGNYVLEG